MDNNNFNQTEPQQPQYYEPPVAQPTWNNDAPSGEEGKTQAIWSLVTGILSVVCCQICCIPAIILAVVAKNKGNKSGLATAGLVLGIIGACLWVFGIIYNITHPDYVEDLMRQLGY